MKPIAIIVLKYKDEVLETQSCYVGSYEDTWYAVAAAKQVICKKTNTIYDVVSVEFAVNKEIWVIADNPRILTL